MPSPQAITTQSIDHLGLVADMIDQLDLIRLVDERLPIKSHGSKVTMGERLAAMILNGLGFVDARLYLFPEFLDKTPVSRLFGRKMEAEWFHDDSLGRCLDAIASYGTTKLFTELSFQIGHDQGLLGKSVHFDTTSLQVEGAYETEEPGSVNPSHGYAKSHRPDLKQMVLNLAITGKSQFPLWMESHSGHASDSKIMPTSMERMHTLCQQLDNRPEFLYVADAAVYDNILQYSSDFKWLTRVPQRNKEAMDLVNRSDNKLQWQPLSEGYHYHMEEVTREGVQQRWALIYSEQAYQREVKTFEKQLQKIEAKNESQWAKLGRELFVSDNEADRAAQKLLRQTTYQQVGYQVEAVMGYAGKGRPRLGAEPSIQGYRIVATLSADESAIASAKRKKGRFILATNQLDQAALPDDELLLEYKAQSGVEKGFKFIKDNSFQVDSIYVKTPHRIDALMMVMTLCLMVFGLMRHQIHEALSSADATFPDQQRRATKKPSLKWVYFLFLGVQEVSIPAGSEVYQTVSNVTDLLKQIISYFGPRARAIYMEPNSG